ncbi:hypothetical protein V6N11_057225 [Hibiscus sabdariffa]|uniref:Uncharacterized protein n=1 Tax=Hibiscus sabdariffa TaxID=183260 RepID=A0ABR2NKH3_9ROSI
MVRASELRFKDDSQVNIQATGKGEGRSDCQTKDSISEATSANRSEEVNSQSHREEKEEALNAAVLENSKNNDYCYDLGETNCHLGESEMQGMEDRSHLCETPEQITLGIEMKDEAVVSKTLKKVIEQVEVPAKLVEISNNYQEFRAPYSDGLSMRAREDLRDMGLGLQDKGIRVSGEGNSSHSQGSYKDGYNQRPQDAVNFVNGEKNFEFPELHYLTKTSKKKERKFGSLSTIQDRFLSEAEKRKRVRIKKHLKKKEIEETISELEGRSITDSDIEARKDFLLKEARKTLDIGKKVGIEFIGDEQEGEVVVMGMGVSQRFFNLTLFELDGLKHGCLFVEFGLLGWRAICDVSSKLPWLFTAFGAGPCMV